MRQSQLQLGKNGVTHEFLVTLKSHFENHDNVRLSVLKSATRDRAELQKITDEILDKLGKNYTAKVIGFTIALRRWRRAVRE